MIDKQKKQLNMKVQWTKLSIVLALYLLFLLWVKSWWGLLVVPFIFDVYITKKIRWQWWKDSEGPVRFIMSWVDALVFAHVAVYFIHLFFFQNFVYHLLLWRRVFLQATIFLFLRLATDLAFRRLRSLCL